MRTGAACAVSADGKHQNPPDEAPTELARKATPLVKLLEAKLALAGLVDAISNGDKNG
jgi:hypothetical protein